MKQLLNNTPPKDCKYIDHIDFNNQCIGYEKKVPGSPGSPRIPLRYLCLPGIDDGERVITIIRDSGTVKCVLSSYRLAREYLNALDDKAHKVYTFKSSQEMWGWMKDTFTTR